MNLFENLQLMKENDDFDNSLKRLVDMAYRYYRDDFPYPSTEEYRTMLGLVYNEYKDELPEILKSKEAFEKIMKLGPQMLRDIDYEKINLRYKSESKTEAPREFFKKVSNAKETLKQFSKEKVDFVRKAYDEILADIGDAFISERGTNTSQIKNDYISIAVEDDIMTTEEFETIYDALLVIGTFESHKYA